MLNEAIFALPEGIETTEDIDRGMVPGGNHPIGPLAPADMVGLGTLLYVIEGLRQELGQEQVPARAAASQDGPCRLSRAQNRQRFL